MRIDMVVLNGKSVFGGIEIGKIAFYKRNVQQVQRNSVKDVEQEICRFHEARESAKEELKSLHDKAEQDLGEDNALIFEMHQRVYSQLPVYGTIHQLPSLIHHN